MKQAAGIENKKKQKDYTRSSWTDCIRLIKKSILSCERADCTCVCAIAVGTLDQLIPSLLPAPQHRHSQVVPLFSLSTHARVSQLRTPASPIFIETNDHEVNTYKETTYVYFTFVFIPLRPKACFRFTTLSTVPRSVRSRASVNPNKTHDSKEDINPLILNQRETIKRVV